MIAPQLNTFSHFSDKAPKEVQKLIDALKKKPIQPETFQLILDQFEINFGVDLSEAKHRLWPTLALENYVRKYPDYIGYSQEKNLLNELGLDLPADLYTKISLDFAMFYGL